VDGTFARGAYTRGLLDAGVRRWWRVDRGTLGVRDGAGWAVTMTIKSSCSAGRGFQDGRLFAPGSDASVLDLGVLYGSWICRARVSGFMPRRAAEHPRMEARTDPLAAGDRQFEGRRRDDSPNSSFSLRAKNAPVAGSPKPLCCAATGRSESPHDIGTLRVWRGRLPRSSPVSPTRDPQFYQALRIAVK